MMRFELRWARELLSAFAPANGRDPTQLSPDEDEVDYIGALQALMRQATPKAAFGLRVAIWLSALAPIWLWGRLTTAASLAVERRTALLAQLLEHRSFFVRELVTLLKFCAAMALLGTPSVRESSNYDLAGDAQSESGLRRRLPLLDDDPQLRVWPAHDGEPSEVPLEKDVT